jgi:aminoglycoside phosphotransferase (APT) family kinase protein
MGETADEQFARLVAKINPQSKLLRSWRLTGGVSAVATGLEIENADGQRRKLVVRQHGDIDRAQNPQIAVDEFRLLQILHTAGIAAPTPYYVDDSGEIFETPCVVMEFIEGESEFAPDDLDDFVRQLADHLAQIHGVDSATYDLSFLPSVEAIHAKLFSERPATVDESIGEGQIREALEPVMPLARRNPPVLLHGDYWTGNVLCRDGQVVAVIDWEDAKLGDPVNDFANARLEILWAFGADAMQNFTRRYQSMMVALDYVDLPYWDLCAALRPAGKLTLWTGGDAAREATMREGLRWFAAQALKQI